MVKLDKNSELGARETRHLSEFASAFKSHTADDGKGIDSVAAADYIGDMLPPLRDMADEADLTFLAYLIDMAFEEARMLAARDA